MNELKDYKLVLEDVISYKLCNDILEEIVLPKEIQEISATKIRKEIEKNEFKN